MDGMVDTAAFYAKYMQAVAIDKYNYTEASRNAIHEAMDVAWSMYYAATI